MKIFVKNEKNYLELVELNFIAKNIHKSVKISI